MRILLLLFLLVAETAFALTLTETGAELTVEYDEPSTNWDLTPLTDLLKTNVYVDGVKQADIPAILSSGGGHILTKVSVLVNKGEEKVITVYATATDISGNESSPSDSVTIKIDRKPPSPPR